MKKTLRTWVRENILFSVFLIALFMILSQVAVVSIIWHNARANQAKLIKQFTDIARSMPTYNQVEILDRLAAYLIDESGGGQIVYCYSSHEVVWSYPLSMHNCGFKDRFGHRKVDAPVFIEKDYPKILFFLPRFHQENILLVSFIMCTMGMAFAFQSVSKIRWKIFSGLLSQISSLGKSGAEFDIDDFEKIHKSLMKVRVLENEFVINNTKLLISQQIAHDIRAPLTVLEQITSSQNPEYDKKMILQATKRIQSITENLLSLSKTNHFNGAIKPKHIFLSHVIKKMIGEKRLQVNGSERFIFSAAEELQSMFLYEQIHLSDVERILSNLIDNSLEALSDNDSKEINIILTKPNNHTKIQIIDNGKGIPPEILSKLCQKGATFGKNNGNGLGLYHAKKTVEEWGGEFKIESQVGVGTTVSFTVPMVAAPHYFALQLSVQPDAHVVILDDDQSIIDSWRARFAKTPSFQGGITDFTKIADFENWLGQQSPNKNFIFLCDFDLGDQHTFGLDLIAKHNLQSKSILVTGRSEDVEIQRRVEALGTKLLPKDWIEDIEIQVLNDDTKTNEQTAVLIDDDELIRDLWQNKAKAKNISLVCYDSSHDFTANISKYPNHTAIYVDSDLKGERGEEFVKHLATNGFLNVTLTTGYPESKFQNMPWVRRVIDKSPPW